MKLDEKYFIPFLGIVAVVAALLILFFTVNSRQGRREVFKSKIIKQDSLKNKYMSVIGEDDSLRVRSFPKQFVILDFWATWTSTFSLEAHKQLRKLKQENPGNIEIIAAVVEDKPLRVKEYIDQHKFSFNFVEGTRVFNKFGVPGVPTQLVYAPGGALKSIFTGYADSTRLDSLRAIITADE